jgi:ABC-type transport system involved in multi-copper enzyme maturation permease subunit
MKIRPVILIARSVLIEAMRRKEIYVIVLACVALIALVMTMDFFELEGLTKFYREIALKTMSTATAITVVVLASRQLPREFETRTIYPLLAKPITRVTFLLGKLVGVMGAAAFCFGLFMLVYVVGTYLLGGGIPWVLFFQYILLQMVMMLVLATLSFWLSMVFTLDAAMVMGLLFFAIASLYSSIIVYLYETATAFGKVMITVMNYVIPQLVLFDLSEKAVHSAQWPALDPVTMVYLVLYGLVFSSIYFGVSVLLFRRRAL